MIPKDMKITDEAREKIRKINENAEKIRDEHRNVEIVLMNKKEKLLNRPIYDIEND